MGSLIVSAKLWLMEGITLHKTALPVHRFTDQDIAFIGEIDFGKEKFTSERNGEIVKVRILADSQFVSKLKEKKCWNIYSGSEQIGHLSLIDFINFEPM